MAVALIPNVYNNEFFNAIKSPALVFFPMIYERYNCVYRLVSFYPFTFYQGNM